MSGPTSTGGPVYLGPNVQQGVQASLQFRRANIAGPDGRKVMQFESMMPQILAPMIAQDEFAKRFAQINGLYAPQAKRIARMKLFTTVGFLTIMLAALGVLFLSQIVNRNPFSIWFAIAPLLGIVLSFTFYFGMIYAQNKKTRALHAEIESILAQFTATDQTRKLQWSLVVKTMLTGSCYSKGWRHYRMEPAVQVSILA